ncbi:MAG: 16S rRNA (cytosine(1402)-N(4))-methyltransferase RsmH [Planctomycetota bacterium]
MGETLQYNSENDGTPIHVPVLCSEFVKLAKIQPGQVWMDGTAGAGGHTRLIAERVESHGRVISLDRDPEAVKRLQGKVPNHVHVVCESYHRAEESLGQLEVESLDGILLDLGLSSDQLEDRQRGFSFQTEGELDMRFNQQEGQPVWQWLQYVGEKELADTIYQFGEERFSRRIAKRIVEARRREPIKTADQLRKLIYEAMPGARRATSGNRKHGRVDPATRTFQALRIAINDELQILQHALEVFSSILKPGGRMLVMSFHSLEDRIVKYAFRENSCWEIITKKPVQATMEEIARNPRSRSAKLRVACKIASLDSP